MAISVAMLGLAVAGLTVYMKPRFFQPANLHSWSNKYSIAFSVVVFISLWIIYRIPVNAYLAPTQIAGKLILIYILSAIPFYFAGLVFSGLFAGFPKKIGKLYAWDLIGAGLGAILMIPLMDIAGGETAGIIVSVLGLSSSILFCGKKWKLNSGLLLIFLIFSLSNSNIGWLRIQYTKGQSLKSLDIRYNRWNTFSRIMVIPFKPGTDAAYTWCPSPNYPLPKMKTFSIMIDDGASSPVLPFDGHDLEPIEYLKYDLTSLAHRMKGDGNTLIIGCGGGRDVLTALHFGATHIDAVDINPLIFEAMNGVLGDFAGRLYYHPKVDLYAAEGRAFTRRRPDTYDLVQIPMIDTWAATTAGAYSLSENTLYTVEAFQDFLHSLKPGGMFSFTRFFFHPPRQALRLVSVFLEAAKREGIENPDKCILVGMYESLATIIFKNEPFTTEEIANFKADLDDLGFYLVYSPDEQPDPNFRYLVTMTDRMEFYKKYPYDMTPTTDDKPFFFNMLKLKDTMKVFQMRDGLKFNYYATFTLIIVLVFSLISVVICLLLPVFLRQGGIKIFKQNRNLLLYFISIGLGYIIIELALLQRFSLLLEHPAYAACGVIAGMLISSGLGSMFWSTVGRAKQKVVLNTAFSKIIVLLFLHWLFGWSVINNVVHLSLSVKIFLTMLMVMPLGFVMGIPLPAGLRRAGEGQTSLVAWCWALNGAASVVASSLAVAIAMHSGFGWVIATGLTCYAFAFLLEKILSGQSDC